ncbi:hypothetical protein Pcinc_005273 [Petrolisthes cinctipes]|uniref:Uncharacterized protein n=1 Tax=Petrolisthes cinctipes TaxID=88211 RepID=A0AAE1GF84_PETCI|nr:hypothetical protein Pcinc_005273 [Petrolisthes cinctipes]
MDPISHWDVISSRVYILVEFEREDSMLSVKWLVVMVVCGMVLLPAVVVVEVHGHPVLPPCKECYVLLYGSCKRDYSCHPPPTTGRTPRAYSTPQPSVPSFSVLQSRA